MKTYVLYHQNCPDGCGAALAAYLKFGEEAEYIPVQYGQASPSIEDGADVFIVDFSYPKAAMEDIERKNCKLVILDHHATAKTDLEGYLPHVGECRFDMNKSGAVLAWEYFHPDKPIPKFILYLQDRDLWQWKLPQSREISAAIGSYPFNFRIWAAWLYDDQLTEHLAEEGKTCLRLKNQQVEIMAKNHQWVWLSMMNTPPGISFGPKPTNIAMSMGSDPNVLAGPCANATVFFSEVGEKLLEMFPEAKFSAYYFDRNDGNRQWGIRARKGFDAASLIAKPMGGGGHPQACGFTRRISQ